MIKLEKMYDEKLEEIVKKAHNKGVIKTYEEFLKDQLAEETYLSEEEVKYYISNKKDYEKLKFNVGDIIFVEDYEYGSGEFGKNHIFVIIYKGKAINIDYFGFLLSSKMNKKNFKYNEVLYKNDINGLHKDSIVKCDSLIEIKENEIKFKIGKVKKDELKKFIDLYAEYLENIKN